MEEDIYKTGVYKITCLSNGKFYIGSAATINNNRFRSGFYKRFDNHKVMLRNNNHPNLHIQRAWNKYGEENFKFEILELCSKDKCIYLEQKYMDLLKPQYNIRKVAHSNVGIKFSDITKKKMSEAHLGRKILWKDKIAKSLLKNDYTKEEGHIKGRVTNVKLSPKEVLEIKILLKEGVILRKIASKYNVCISTISGIKIGKIWPEIKMD